MNLNHGHDFSEGGYSPPSAENTRYFRAPSPAELLARLDRLEFQLRELYELLYEFSTEQARFLMELATKLDPALSRSSSSSVASDDLDVG